MSKRRGQSKSDQLMFWSGEPRAKVSALPANAPASMTPGEELCSRTLNSLSVSGHVGSYGRMSLVYCPPPGGEILEPLSGRWSTWGIGLIGGFLTLDGSEFPSDAVVSSLLQVLVTTAQPKYCLSARAAAGILLRAERRGKAIVEPLRTALQRCAASGIREPEGHRVTSAKT